MEELSASRNHLVFDYYGTVHGFSHATCVVEVILSVNFFFFDFVLVVIVFLSLSSLKFKPLFCETKLDMLITILSLSSLKFKALPMISFLSSVQVVRHLILVGHDVHVVTGAPDFVFTTDVQSPRLFLRKVGLTFKGLLTDYNL